MILALGTFFFGFLTTVRAEDKVTRESIHAFLANVTHPFRVFNQEAMLQFFIVGFSICFTWTND